MLTDPSSDTTWLAASVTASGSVTSQRIDSAASGEASRSSEATRAPCSASASESARPSPPAPPVITAVARSKVGFCEGK